MKIVSASEVRIELTDEELTKLLQVMACESLDFWIIEVAHMSLPFSGNWQVKRIERNIVTLSLSGMDDWSL